MLDFIIKYWLQVLFGLLVSGAGVFCKFYFSTKEKEKEEIIKAVQELKNDTTVKDEVKLLKDGLLSLQGRAFKKECRKYLQNDHVITLEEYEELSVEHNVYNSLGGNHLGDSLFDQVEKKYQSGLKNE